MPDKGNSAGQCERCRIYRPLCLCAEIPSHRLDTRVIVLMHWRERMLTTNTARLACLALSNSEIRLRGGRIPQLSPEEWLPKGSHPVLLYPTDDALELTPESARSLPRPVTLLVPDGSWRQARKVATREKELLSVPRVKLLPGPPSDFRLRFTPHDRNLSTLEAIARALGVLEGEEIRKSLELLLLKMVERRLWSRGQLDAAHSLTGIPQAAFDAAREAGIAGTRKRNGT